MLRSLLNQKETYRITAKNMLSVFSLKVETQHQHFYLFWTQIAELH